MPLILVIEDEKIIRENTIELLEGNGYECIWANNGRTGLELACSQSPDLIVCDIMLPFINGYEIKLELNKLEEKCHLPFIFLTAKSEREDLRNGMDLGAADFITKPFKIGELLSSISRRLLQQYEINQSINSRVIDSLGSFIQVAKHECNTPLNAILNLSEILMAPDLRKPETVRDLSACINLSGKRLNKTLNNLIDLVRLQHYKDADVAYYKYFSLDDCIGQILQRQARLFKRPLDYSFESTRANCINFLQEDASILFTELINNAFKFSEPGTIVNVKMVRQSDGDTVTVIICNISAFPVQFTQHNIAPFKQFNRDINEQQGSGLGLYLSKLICQSNNGELTIDADSDGNVIAAATIKTG